MQTWSLKRSEQYGSKHYDENILKVTAATLFTDGKTVTILGGCVRPIVFPLARGPGPFPGRSPFLVHSLQCQVEIL